MAALNSLGPLSQIPASGRAVGPAGHREVVRRLGRQTVNQFDRVTHPGAFPFVTEVGPWPAYWPMSPGILFVEADHASAVRMN